MIEQYLNRELVFPELKAQDKSGVIRELAQDVATVCPFLSSNMIEAALLERENLDSTAIEKGIAIPHAKVTGIEKPLVAIGKSRTGIDFNSHDKNLTHLFFVLLAPYGSVAEHLKLLARLARILSLPDARERLILGETPKVIYDTLIELELEI